MDNYPEEDPGPVFVPPASVELARGDIISLRRAMGHMERELSGCDWCCGGGSESYNLMGWQISSLETWLKEQGEELPEAKQLCLICGYLDGAVPHPELKERPVCQPCFDTFYKSEAPLLRTFYKGDNK